MASSVETAQEISRQIRMLAAGARSADLTMTVAALEFAAFVIEEDIERIQRNSGEAD